MDAQDRRVTRSKQLIRGALMSLLAEKRFDKITVEDILKRADVGRTTFYAHFQSKEDLFLDSHEQIIWTIANSFVPDSLSATAGPSPDLVAFLAEMGQPGRDMYFFLTWGSASGEILRLLQKRIADQILARLQERFSETDSAVPFSLLAQHIAGSIVSICSWWMANKSPCPAAELAAMLHRMNLAALRDALAEQPPG